MALEDDDVPCEENKEKEEIEQQKKRGAVGCVSSSREKAHKDITQPALKVAREVVHLVKWFSCFPWHDEFLSQLNMRCNDVVCWC